MWKLEINGDNVAFYVSELTIFSLVQRVLNFVLHISAVVIVVILQTPSVQPSTWTPSASPVTTGKQLLI